MVKTRIPYENATAPRSDLLKVYRQALKSGAISPPERDGEYFKEIFVGFGGQASPKDGWGPLSIELRLVELAVFGRANSETSGTAKIAADCRDVADKISTIRRSIAELSNEPDFLLALLYLGLSDSNWHHIQALDALRAEIERVADHQAGLKQPPKWRDAHNRRLRVQLAVRLSTLFEEQFGQPAKPIGGSAAVDVTETNDWTRFFQMAAKAFWGEAASPDRQAVLREATFPQAWTDEAVADLLERFEGEYLTEIP